jgi:hypothetical protein
MSASMVFENSLHTYLSFSPLLMEQQFLYSENKNVAHSKRQLSGRLKGTLQIWVHKRAYFSHLSRHHSIPDKSYQIGKEKLKKHQNQCLCEISILYANLNLKASRYTLWVSVQMLP